jgi:two-component system response regulator
MDNKVILLVEDNPRDEALTLRALKKGNILNEIVVARDGVEALDYIFARGKYVDRDISERPQLVLLDLKLPKVDGFEVLGEIRRDQRTRNQPVVVFTSSDEEADLVKSYDLGANSYVRKPVDFDHFLEATKQLGLYWLLTNMVAPSTGNNANG